MKHKITTAIIIASIGALAQPIGTPPAAFPGFTPPQVRDVANSAWFRGGNNPGGTAGNNNIFGTMWNSPIY